MSLKSDPSQITGPIEHPMPSACSGILAPWLATRKFAKYFLTHSYTFLHASLLYKIWGGKGDGALAEENLLFNFRLRGFTERRHPSFNQGTNLESKAEKLYADFLSDTKETPQYMF